MENKTKKERKGSWPVFFMVIGMLFIMASPRAEKPAAMILGGLLIVLMSFIVWRRDRGRKQK